MTVPCSSTKLPIYRLRSPLPPYHRRRYPATSMALTVATTQTIFHRSQYVQADRVPRLRVVCFLSYKRSLFLTSPRHSARTSTKKSKNPAATQGSRPTSTSTKEVTASASSDPACSVCGFFMIKILADLTIELCCYCHAVSAMQICRTDFDTQPVCGVVVLPKSCCATLAGYTIDYMERSDPGESFTALRLSID